MCPDSRACGQHGRLWSISGLVVPGSWLGAKHRAMVAVSITETQGGFWRQESIYWRVADIVCSFAALLDMVVSRFLLCRVVSRWAQVMKARGCPSSIESLSVNQSIPYHDKWHHGSNGPVRWDVRKAPRRLGDARTRASLPFQGTLSPLWNAHERTLAPGITKKHRSCRFPQSMSWCCSVDTRSSFGTKPPVDPRSGFFGKKLVCLALHRQASDPDVRDAASVSNDHGGSWISAQDP